MVNRPMTIAGQFRPAHRVRHCAMLGSVTATASGRGWNRGAALLRGSQRPPGQLGFERTPRDPSQMPRPAPTPRGVLTPFDAVMQWSVAIQD